MSANLNNTITQVSIGFDRLLKIFPSLADIKHPEWWAILNRSQTVNIPANTALYKEFNADENLVLILRGTVRVYQTNKDGRELTLYRCQAGQLCSVNVQRLMLQQSTAENRAVNETIVQALIMNAADFHTAMAISEEFRKLVITTLTTHMAQLVQQTHEQTFNTLDERLCEYLKREFRLTQSNMIHITHQQLACELGTTREVVSRSLKQLENKGCLRLLRGKIELLSAEALSEDTA